jgi:hypothetical protein
MPGKTRVLAATGRDGDLFVLRDRLAQRNAIWGWRRSGHPPSLQAAPSQSSASHELLILKLTSPVADKVGCASQTKVAFRLVLVLSMQLPRPLAPSARLPWPPLDPGAAPITSVRLRPIANLAGTSPVPWPPTTSGTGDAPGRFSTHGALLQAHCQCRAPLSRSHVPSLQGTLPITSDRLRLGPILYTTHSLSPELSQAHTS